MAQIEVEVGRCTLANPNDNEFTLTIRLSYSFYN